MQWPGCKQSRPVQMNVSINRGKKTGSFFWMRLIWTVWALALVLLVRSVWVSLQFASNSTPSSEVSERHKIGKQASQKIDIISSNIGGQPRKKNIINEEPRAPGDKPGAKKSPTQTFNRTKTKVAPTSASASGTPTATVAHAISFLSCSASLTSKYLDAMLLLRHSIHQNSIHAKNPVSKYSYKMYAFVNSDPAKNCRRHTSWIKQMGYTPLLRPNPVNISSITNDYFRNQIDKTGVAGSSELIKLYLYTLEEYPIVVHWDIDVIVLVSPLGCHSKEACDFQPLTSHYPMHKRNQWMICSMPCSLTKIPRRGRVLVRTFAFNNLCTRNCLIGLMHSSPEILRLPGRGRIGR